MLKHLVEFEKKDMFQVKKQDSAPLRSTPLRFCSVNVSILNTNRSTMLATVTKCFILNLFTLWQVMRVEINDSSK
jgi:hypothetical protein